MTAAIILIIFGKGDVVAENVPREMTFRYAILTIKYRNKQEVGEPEKAYTKK